MEDKRAHTCRICPPHVRADVAQATFNNNREWQITQNEQSTRKRNSHVGLLLQVTQHLARKQRIYMYMHKYSAYTYAQV